MTEHEGALFIGGEFREARSGRRFEVINPADETVVGTAADAASEDVALAVSAARHAADETSWGTDHAFRQRCLRQLQEGLRKQADTARALQVAEAGICVSNLATHVDAMIEDMSWFIELIGRFGWETDFPPYELMAAQPAPGAVRAVRRGRRDHAVERAADDRHLEDHARAGHR